MQIVNRTPDRLGYLTFDNKTTAAPKSAWDGPPLAPNATVDIPNTPDDGLQVWVAPYTDGGPTGSPDWAKGAAIDATDWVLVTKVDGTCYVVSWGQVWGEVLYRRPGPPDQLEADKAILFQTATFGGHLINALSASLGVPQPTALPDQAVLRVDSLLLMALNATTARRPPPQLPDLAALLATIEHSIPDDEQLAQAKKATVFFFEAAKWYLGHARVAYDQAINSPGQPISSFDEKRFATELEQFLDAGKAGFQSHLQALMQQENAETAKWILPSLKVGIAMHLQLYRLHDALQHLYGAPVTGANVTDLVAQLSNSKAGMTRAYQALRNYINSQIGAAHLITGDAQGRTQDTAEGSDLRSRLSIMYTSQYDITGFNNLSYDCDQMIRAVQNDPANLWRQEWKIPAMMF